MPLKLFTPICIKFCWKKFQRSKKTKNLPAINNGSRSNGGLGTYALKYHKFADFNLLFLKNFYTRGGDTPPQTPPLGASCFDNKFCTSKLKILELREKLGKKIFRLRRAFVPRYWPLSVARPQPPFQNSWLRPCLLYK